MSIAVSAVVLPSRTLLLLEIGVFLGVATVGLLIGSGIAGQLNLFSRSALAACCVFLSCWLINLALTTRKSLHIDISGIGQIRLAEHNELAAASKDNAEHSSNAGEVFQLVAGSTIWPYLLLLRLQSEDQQIRILPILPDCVGANSFRALSVACRWIATQDNSGEYKNL